VNPQEDTCSDFLQPASQIESEDAEAYARLKFIRVLQSWACDRLTSQTNDCENVPVGKAA